VVAGGRSVRHGKTSKGSVNRGACANLLLGARSECEGVVELITPYGSAAVAYICGGRCSVVGVRLVSEAAAEVGLRFGLCSRLWLGNASR